MNATLHAFLLCFVAFLDAAFAVRQQQQQQQPQLHQQLQQHHHQQPTSSQARFAQEQARRHQYLKQLRIDTIRKQVMEKLRLPPRLPTMNVTREIPRVVFQKALQKLRMRDDIKLQKTGMQADAYAQISEIVSFSESGELYFEHLCRYRSFFFWMGT